MSAPAKGIPTSPGCRTALTCHLRSCHVDAESPVQCAVYAPEPTNDDLQDHASSISVLCAACGGFCCTNVLRARCC